jgi:subtilisin family serine protease
MKTYEAAAGSPWRRAVGVALLALVVQFPATVTSAAAQVAASDTKIDAGLLAGPDDKEVTFWVTFTRKADLRPAGRAVGWSDRGQAVVDELQRTAQNSHAGVAGLLASRGTRFDSYWIANTGKVTGPKSLMRQLAARPEVARIEPDRTYQIPEPAAGANPAPQAVEWNITAVNAPAVWDGLGVTGQGIVVANVDTGVQFDHPALVNQYRGNLGDAFDHNYNWFDPSNVCGAPSVVPCDNNRHGTHTMGTILGDDGTGQNGIGVAPGARWIAVKGCEQSSCSQTALLAGGQWLLAPTDLDGQNPRPDLRPNVVNNSWGGGGGSLWYRDIVRAWEAAGIFPVFSNGNSGPSCGTAGSPADYAESYAVGAHNSAGAIAYFSSRSSTTGVMKPDIAAPGENVRSSVPGSAYSLLSGTSMAAPHVAGAVALMWSAAPSLTSDVARTREILDETAIDVPDLTCGGTSSDNGVWGQGKLDALAAVMSSPRGPVGTLAGVVVDQASGGPVAGAQVRTVGSSPFPRVGRTSATGAFSQTLAVGTYQMEVTAFGYAGASAQVTVRENETTVADIALVAAPHHAVSGTVRDGAGALVEGSSVSLAGTPLEPVSTDQEGRFRFPVVPDGDYQLVASPSGPCTGSASDDISFDADVTVDLVIEVRRDAFGYSCRQEVPAYVEATDVLPVSGDDTFISVPLPFPFSFYGKSYPTAHVSTNGMVGWTSGSHAYSNRPVPDPSWPNGTIYAFWDDLYVDSSSSVRTASLGDEGDRRFVIEWRNVRFYGADTTLRFDVEVILDQRGGILLQYRSPFVDPRVRGSGATIGIENETGTVGLQYSANQTSLPEGTSAVRFEAAGSVGNVAPNAVADNAATIAGMTVNSLRVLTNDRDADGDPLDVTGTSDPAGGLANVRADNTIDYIPDLGFSGIDAFTYDLADGRGGTDRATVTVTVAPLAVDDTASTAEDTAVNVQVLANDLNPQAGLLSVLTVSLPLHGTASSLGGGLIRYTPHPNYNGPDVVPYTVVDGRGGLDVGTIAVSVSPVDDPPRATDDFATVMQNGSVRVMVLVNDVDFDGHPLRVVSVSDPLHGSTLPNPDQTVTYVPHPGYVGADTFTYDVSNGAGGTARATVTVTVVPPPTTTTIPLATTTTTAPPPPPATMSAPYSIWAQPAPLGLDGTGTWLWTVNDPTGSSAQLAASYMYGLSLGFTSSSARGFLGLATGPGGKTASLTVVGPNHPPLVATVPFAWTANGVYFMFVHQYGPGSWSAAVYDYAHSTWTLIGTLALPVAWGRLSSTTVTVANWTEPPAATCAAYPAATVLVHAPIGYLPSSGAVQTFLQGGTTAGACGSVEGAGPPGWRAYSTGTP